MNIKKFEKLKESLVMLKGHARNKRAYDRVTKKYSLCHLSLEQAIIAVQIYPNFYLLLPNHLKKQEVELASKL